MPDLAQDSLISGPKFAEAGYVTLLTPKELLIFDGEDLKMTVSKEAVLREWRDPGSRGVWRIPLEPDKTPMQSKYVLLNKAQQESVRTVYELPSTKQIFSYLHACAGSQQRRHGYKENQCGNLQRGPI